MKVVAIIFGIIFFLFFIYFAVVSIKENEKRAAKRAFVLSLILPIPFILIPVLLNEIYSTLLISILIIFGMILFFPVKIKKSRENEIPLKRYDERDIMFSRNELIPGTAQFIDYYKGIHCQKILTRRIYLTILYDFYILI